MMKTLPIHPFFAYFSGLFKTLCGLFLFFAGFVSYHHNEPQRFDDVVWYDYDEALELADGQDKTLLLFMEAEWCSFCKRMESEVFPLQGVQEAIEADFIPVKIDIESENSLRYRGREITQKGFSKEMNLRGTPTFIFMSPDEEVIGSMAGFLDSRSFLQLLEYIATGSYVDSSLEEYVEREWN